MGRFGLGFSHRLLKGLKGSANTHSTASNLKDGGKTEHASGELDSQFMKIYRDTFQVLTFGYGVIRYDNSRCEDTDTAIRIQVLLQDGNKKLQEIYDCCKEFKITKDDKTSSTLKKG